MSDYCFVNVTTGERTYVDCSCDDEHMCDACMIYMAESGDIIGKKEDK